MTKRRDYNGPRINIDPDLVIGTREAAFLLGVGEREVRYKIQRKKLPALKIGNRYYINARAPLFYLKVQEILRPRWSANRTERQRRHTADKKISPGFSLNPVDSPTSEKNTAFAYPEDIVAFEQEYPETRPYLRHLHFRSLFQL